MEFRTILALPNPDGEVTGDVEICQQSHRYAVVWPSIHPDTGTVYRWYTPDGVVATLAASALPSPTGQAGFVLALDQLQDPGNLGTLLRTALAAGVEEVWLGGGADPLQPKVLRASAGAALALPLRRAAERPELMGWLQAAAGRGQQVVATLVDGGQAQPYWQLDWTRPTVLLLGNEVFGAVPAIFKSTTSPVAMVLVNTKLAPTAELTVKPVGAWVVK